MRSTTSTAFMMFWEFLNDDCKSKGMDEYSYGEVKDTWEGSPEFERRYWIDRAKKAKKDAIE